MWMSYKSRTGNVYHFIQVQTFIPEFEDARGESSHCPAMHTFFYYHYLADTAEGVCIMLRSNDDSLTI